MNEPTENLPTSWLLTKVAFRRKVIAFLTIGLTTFLLLSLFWPLSTRGFASKSQIEIGLAQRPDAAKKFKPLLNDVLRRQTSPESIARIVESSGLTGELSFQQKHQQAEVIRERLNVSLKKIDRASNRYAVEVHVEGTGSPRENYLANVLATEMARDFMMSPLAAIMPSDAGDPTKQIASLEARRLSVRQRADELITQIENNLAEVRSAITNGDGNENDILANVKSESRDFQEPSGFAALAKTELNETIRNLINQRALLAANRSEFDPELLQVDRELKEARAEFAALGQPAESASPFNMASFAKKPTGGTASVAEIEQRLGDVDVAPLRQIVNELASVASDATSAAEAGGGGPVFSVEAVSDKNAIPIGGVPSQRDFLMLGFLSTLFAGFVASFFKPFADKGFENEQAVADGLGLPVLATVDSRYRYDETTGSGVLDQSAFESAPMANQLVKACEIALFVVVMLAIGFCLVDAEVRNAFWENPFHGFSRIVWMFRG